MKYRIILIFSLFFIGMFGSKAFAANDIIRSYSQATNTTLEKNDKLWVKVNQFISQKKAASSFNKIPSSDVYYIETSSYSLGSFRPEQRYFLDALFLSFFLFIYLLSVSNTSCNTPLLQFVPYSLKVIYPFHHFW